MRFAPILRFLILFFCGLGFVPALLAGTPRFTTINYSDGVTTATATVVLGINPAGDIVGAWDDAAGKEHGFLLRGGQFTSFDYPATPEYGPSTWTDAYGITPQGDIIGQYGRSDNTTQGFLLRDGQFFPVDLAGPQGAGALRNSMPYALSPEGQIVGCYHQGYANGKIIAGTMHGFVLSAAGLSFDEDPGSMHQGVNPDGDITGYMTTDGRSYVISGSDGTKTWFTFPGALATRATNINTAGDIVGWYKDASGHIRGFLRQAGGAMSSIDVDLPGVTSTHPSGINSVGEIVGYYSDAEGWHGFLLSRRGPE